MGFLSSLGGWLVETLVLGVFRSIRSYMEKLKQEKLEKEESDKATKAYLDVVTKPGATREEIKDAQDRFHNS